MSRDATGADFSSCRVYRYRLWRTWGEGKPLVWIMLNPSTADEVANDPTIERCERRARMWGHGGIVVANLFALRSTDPKALRGHADPIGPDNDETLRAVCRDAGMVICAWGQHGKFLARAAKVHRLIKSAGIQPYALRLGKDGQPAHPLYLSYELQPFEWAA
jgi:hypothetical protein